MCKDASELSQHHDGACFVCHLGFQASINDLLECAVNLGDKLGDTRVCDHDGCGRLLGLQKEGHLLIVIPSVPVLSAADNLAKNLVGKLDITIVDNLENFLDAFQHLGCGFHSVRKLCLYVRRGVRDRFRLDVSLSCILSHCSSPYVQTTNAAKRNALRSCRLFTCQRAMT